MVLARDPRRAHGPSSRSRTAWTSAAYPSSTSRCSSRATRALRATACCAGTIRLMAVPPRPPGGPSAPTLGRERTVRPVRRLPGGRLPAPPTSRRRRARRPRPLLGPVLLVNLAAQVGIVVTGGVVRLTGSGLGCPTWPQCVPGSYTPTVRQAQGGTRTSSSATGCSRSWSVSRPSRSSSSVTAWVLPHGRAPAGSLAFAAVPILGVVAQAVLGGDHRADQPRAGGRRGALPVSMVLVSASTVLLLALTAAGGARRPSVVRGPRRRRRAGRRRRRRPGPRHRCHRLRPALRGRRDAVPVRVRPAIREPGCMPTPSGCSSGSCWR